MATPIKKIFYNELEGIWDRLVKDIVSQVKNDLLGIGSEVINGIQCEQEEHLNLNKIYTKTYLIYINFHEIHYYIIHIYILFIYIIKPTNK